MALPCAMAFTFIGLVAARLHPRYPMLLASVAMIGVGSAIFHPEASRAARAASGGRYGLAQSLFQVGGNFGQSLGPLMAAFIVVPVRPALGARVHRARLHRHPDADPHRPLARRRSRRAQGRARRRDRRRCRARVVARSMAILVVLVFSKMFYLASLQSYYTFYLIQTFGVSVQTSQVLLFVFLARSRRVLSSAARSATAIGRKFVIWLSILGVLPFTLLLPHLGLVGTVIDSVAIGLVLSSAFSAIVVYAQELPPGNVGAIAGLFFGLSFGLGGIGAAALGCLADQTSLTLRL